MNFMSAIRTPLLLAVVLLSTNVLGQQKIENIFGKGIVNIIAQDSTYSMKLGARFQNLFVFEMPLDTTGDFTTDFQLRRARLKMAGFAFSPKLKYNIELGFSSKDLGGANSATGGAPRIVLDAVIKWNFWRNMELWVGQTKLPGNRERVISSQQLQFVDRSILNSRFNIDRDVGVQLRTHREINGVVIHKALSVSQGEGRNILTGNQGGFDYTARLEVLPLGLFTANGDYSGSDLQREEKPKLAVGFTYDYHDNAVRAQGQLGDFLIAERDLESFMVDMMFKYKGISVMAEWIEKSADLPLLYENGTAIEAFWIGDGFNVQAGYLCKANWEVALRYSQVNPHGDTKPLGRADEGHYTLGVSKFLKGHNLKWQSDITYIVTEYKPDADLMVRMQVELAF